MSLNRRQLLLWGAAIAAVAPTSPAAAARRRTPPAPRLLNDASGLNPTPIARQVVIPPGDGTVRALRVALGEAAAENRPFAAGGARHSMGGQSLPRDGVAASFGTPQIELDTAKRSYRVGAGARWHDVIRALDPRGFSPAVMQSNNDFSIGGSLSVNAHGWPAPFGPIASTVLSARMMLADGSVVTCSLTENADLFRAAAGGYGLCGILLDAELAMVPNATLLPSSELIRADDAANRFAALAAEPATAMLYGRLSVARANFLEEAMLVRYAPAPRQPNRMAPPRKSAAYSYVSKKLFRGQTGSERGKQLRWAAETQLIPRMSRIAMTRNTLLDTPVAMLGDADALRTDILHEYFVPPPRFAEFLAACRTILPAHRQDLLNVTLRHVEADAASMLAYAPERRIAAVMLFSQKKSRDDEADMRAMTQALIERTLGLGGSYYLPYRVHATPAQIRRAYPQLQAFIAAKHRYDPQTRLRNAMWDAYMAQA